MAYKISYTDIGWSLFIDALEYLLYHVGGDGSAQAAENFLDDYNQTVSKLESMASSYSYCQNERQKKLGLRKIHLRRMKYKIIFHIENPDTVVIDAIFHDRQDYENQI